MEGPVADNLKLCILCNERKERALFSEGRNQRNACRYKKSKEAKAGRMGEINAKRRADHEREKDRVNARTRELRAANREHVNELKREWAANNKEKTVMYHKQYREEHEEDLAARNKES